MTEPSGLEAIICSSSSPYNTWTWRKISTFISTSHYLSRHVFRRRSHHAPGQAAVQHVLEVVDGRLVDGQGEEGLEGAAVGGRDDDAVEDPHREHRAGRVRAAGVAVPRVALADQRGEGEPGAARGRAPGLQLLLDHLRSITVPPSLTLEPFKLDYYLFLCFCESHEGGGDDEEADEDEEPDRAVQRGDEGEELVGQLRVGRHEHHVVNVEGQGAVHHLGSVN